MVANLSSETGLSGQTCGICGGPRMPHHSARYCKPCSAKLRNDRAVAANRKKYAEKKANRVKKFCACGKDITLLNHLAIRCHECTKTIKAKRNMARYWKGKERKPTQTTCKVCGEPKVEGRLLCQTCKNWDRSEKYYKRRRHMAPKGGRFDYDKFKGYPSHTKEYHRYTAMESIKRRNNKSDPCVYMMQCGGLIYIGQTKRDMELRIQQHKYASQKHGSRIYRAMRSGYEVTYDVLERVAIAELRLAENYYIAAYRDLYGDRVVNERLNRRSAHA